MRIFTLILAVLTTFFPLTFAHAAVPLNVTATQGIVLDAGSGQVLWAKGAQERMATSSMSKVLTAMVVFDAIREGKIKLTDTMIVSEKAWRMQGSKMFVDLGAQVPVEDLIKGMIVQSGNDACIVLAEGIAGSEEAFATRMNEKAQQLGLKNSHFTNVTGWPDPNHYSTPEDLALLAMHLINDYPEEYKYYSIPEFTWNKIKQGNRNPLLGRVAGGDGIKTGHTEEAGYGLIGSAVQNNRRILFVMNGWEKIMDRYREAPDVIEWAIHNFETVTLAKANTPLTHIDIAYGAEKTVPVGLPRDLTITQPVGSSNQKMRYVVRGKTPLTAPVAKGAQIAQLVALNPDGSIAAQFPIEALAAVKKGSIVDTIRTNVMNLLK